MSPLRRPPLPDDLHAAWWSFVDCAEVVEGGRRRLLATLPTGRVEPAPIGIGLDAVGAAIDDAEAWLPRWRVAPVEGAWADCAAALREARDAIEPTRHVANTTTELEELLTAVQTVIDPLSAFGDAERAWRRAYRLPRERPDATDLDAAS